MFRARFSDVFPRSLPHYGPQDIERGVVESPPGDYIERLLCALLGLVLNRKKDVEYDARHYLSSIMRRKNMKQCNWWTSLEERNRNGANVRLVRAGEITTNVRWKKLLARIGLSGPRHGDLRILYKAAEHSRQCRQKSV